MPGRCHRLVYAATRHWLRLPQSALDTLRPGNQTRRADAYRLADRTVFNSQRLVNGRQELTVHVREDVLGRNR